MKGKVILGMTVGLLSYLTSVAQIQFVTARSWNDVLSQAKAQHKWIFVDCYASWCGPCKWMDNNVYDQRSVGDVYNAGFICIRMQMDTTKKDDTPTRTGRPVAIMLDNNYHIDAYPTYLFFDENGQPMHKQTGSMEAKQFITLAADAKDPAKEYYALLKQFEPGKLDTAEEKALIQTFSVTDKDFSGRLAADYLQRVPEKRLLLPGNIQLLVTYNADNGVKTIIKNYLTKHEDYPDAKLLLALNKLPEVKEVAKSYIDKLPEDSLYTSDNIRLMVTFTTALSDRGFDEFFHHGDRIDAVMKQKDYSLFTAASMVDRFEFARVFQAAKVSGVVPDFETEKQKLAKQFSPQLAELVITDNQLNWYKFMIRTKKDTTCWPQLIDAQIRQINDYHWNIVDKRFYVNNICYGFLFLHGTSKRQLATGIAWMKEVVLHNDDPAYLDTYAALLYKAGYTNIAMATEQKAVDIMLKYEQQKEAQTFQSTLDRMKRGEKFWEEREYQTSL